MSSIQKRLTDLLKRLNDCQVPKTKGKNLPRPDQEQPNYNNFTSITAAEKKKLAERINLLPETDLHYVIEICFRHKRNKARDEAGVYDIDLDRLDAKVLKELSNFVASRTKWVRKSSKRETSQRQLSQAEEVEEEPENNPFFNEEAQLDNEDNQLRMYDPIGFEHNLLDDPEDSPPNIYQQPHFDFAHRDLLDMGIDNSDGQSYHPEQEDEGDIRY